jgi:hypothetical protein
MTSAARYLACLALASGGCALMRGPHREFVSQEEVLEAAARTAGYSPPASRFRLVRADISRDSITFQYLGTEAPGDTAWVIRFAQKSTEQKPEALASLATLLEAIAKGKAGFEVIENGRRYEGAVPVEFARYRYLSPIRSDSGRAVPGVGIAAIVKIEETPAPIIYKMNFENYAGGRTEVGWTEMEPLIGALPRSG